jgi:hypothetical protein
MKNVILIFLLSVIAQPAGNQTLTIYVGENQLVPINELNKFFELPEQDFKYTVISNAETLKFAPNSGYFIYDSPSLIKVVDMEKKSRLSEKGELLIPIIEFFEKADNSGLLKAQIDKGTVFLFSTEIFGLKKNEKSIPQEHFKKISSGYVLPDSLVRSELE